MEEKIKRMVITGVILAIVVPVTILFFIGTPYSTPPQGVTVDTTVTVRDFYTLDPIDNARIAVIENGSLRWTTPGTQIHIENGYIVVVADGYYPQSLTPTAGETVIYLFPRPANPGVSITVLNASTGENITGAVNGTITIKITVNISSIIAPPTYIPPGILGTEGGQYSAWLVFTNATVLSCSGGTVYNNNSVQLDYPVGNSTFIATITTTSDHWGIFLTDSAFSPENAEVIGRWSV